MPEIYRGRFAPSPTGPLHFGSLLTAVASYLDAKHHHGIWLVRLEDVDGTRCHPHYQQNILDTLNSYQLISDEAILVQSERHQFYEHYLSQLINQRLAFPCNCTRAELKQYMGLHPYTCQSNTEQAHSWRAQCDKGDYRYLDPIQGEQHFDLSIDPNFPVLKRKDGYFSYQLAVVIDDHLQNITHIVRGADLLETTGQQLWLYEQFNWTPPKLSHLPLVVNASGDKISKQNHAKAIDNGCHETLKRILYYLGYSNIPQYNNIQQLLDWAIPAWQPQRLNKHNLSLKENDQHFIS